MSAYFPDEDAVFDDLKIRNKLILLLAGPLVIVLLLSVIGARARQTSASESRDVETQVTTARANSDVVNALQVEALHSSAFVGSDRTAWAEQVAESREATDAVLAVALPRLTDGIGGSSASVRSAARLAEGAADKLAYYREAVDQGFRNDQVSELVASYTDIQNTFLAVNTNIAEAMTDPQVASDLRSADALAAYKSSLARQGALLAGAAELGSFGTDKAFNLFTNAIEAEETQFGVLQSVSDLSRKGAVRDSLASDGSVRFKELRTEGVAAGIGGALSTPATEVVESTTTVLEDLHGVESDLFEGLIDQAQEARASAEWASNLFVFAAIASILGAGFAAFVLGTRITRPLRRLTEAADHLSSEQMPRLIETLKNPSEDELGFQLSTMKPIEIDSDDEIGRLAKAFNEVQRVAGEVATEQAVLLRKGIGEMFVNLARRNQALLDRQIDFIDELERGEEDPDQLENLYRLDHLATRMRRNAESLLVLAGAEPPRRRGKPAPLANVVRAALAEVEDFGRIDLLSFDEVLVASNAAADLAHLLSELMENATNFSPPETKVEVVGHKTKADGYVISITDHGIGMSAAQIAEANDSLARPPLVGLAMSRSLGFIVVGRLAARHGISVRTMPSAVGGITAVVSLPASLVVDTPGGLTSLPTSDAPARLKPVLEGTGSNGGSPLSFAPSSDQGGSLGLQHELERLHGIDPEPVAPAPRGFDEVGLPTAGAEEPARHDAALAAEVDAAVGPAIPAALSFEAPPASLRPQAPVEPVVPDPGASSGAQHLDGPPPPAPSSNRPFFLEDAEPPRTFGARPAPSVPPTPPEVVAPAPPRLFGGPPTSTPVAPPVDPVETPTPAVAPVDQVDPAAQADAAPLPLASRRPKAAAPSVSEPAVAPEPPLPLAAPEPPAVAAAPAAAAPEAPVTTSAGLAKRVPRAAGASRAIPGSEVERGVSATKRSPEEIRAMLSQHSAGRQRARVQEPVPAGTPEERETP